jgi:hypothetical protein
VCIHGFAVAGYTGAFCEQIITVAVKKGRSNHWIYFTAAGAFAVLATAIAIAVSMALRAKHRRDRERRTRELLPTREEQARLIPRPSDGFADADFVFPKEA